MESGKSTLIKNKALHCTFCGKGLDTLSQESKLVIRKTNFKKESICTCIDCINELNKTASKNPIETKIKQKFKNIEDIKLRKKITPKCIHDKLSQNVIGQNIAKQDIAIAITEHLKNDINQNNFKKQNIIMIGPSGSGKTEIVRSLSKILTVPVVITDATSLTATGYVGEDVENLLYQLWAKSENNISIAEKGIIFIDEIDKLSQKNLSDSDSQIGTRSVQESLLKMIEGTIVNVPKNGNKKTAKEFIQFDTKNILFICAGAFPTLEKEEQSRPEKNKQEFLNNIEFIERNIKVANFEEYTSEDRIIEEDNHSYYRIEDIVNYGLIKEFIGRFSVITYTDRLSKSTLIEILEKSKKSPLLAKKEFFKSYNQKIVFTDEYLSALANKAIEINTGARSLDLLVNRSLKSACFHLPTEGRGTIEVLANKIIFSPSSKSKKKIILPLILG